jgi:diketogulonate reductase-like aldo/keto reductase
MAYSPLDQGRLGGKPGLKAVAARHGVTPLQIALAWSMLREGVLSIPKAGRIEHVEQNRAAADLELSAEDVLALDAAFAPPKGKRSLEIL